jgi:hypothetical protein
MVTVTASSTPILINRLDGEKFELESLTTEQRNQKLQQRLWESRRPRQTLCQHSEASGRACSSVAVWLRCGFAIKPTIVSSSPPVRDSRPLISHRSAECERLSKRHKRYIVIVFESRPGVDKLRGWLMQVISRQENVATRSRRLREARY